MESQLQPSSSALAPIFAHLRGEPSRTWSLIVTVFGDAFMPRGGAVWLGTLLSFFRSLDIGDGVVRTAMSRLTTDGWLERKRVGRNSFYRLAEGERQSFLVAAKRIYARRAPAWTGVFDLFALAAAGDAAEREAIKAKLEGFGFGLLSAGVWIAPGGTSFEGADGLLRFQMRGEDGDNRAVAARAWPLAQTGEAYRRFLAAFRPLQEALDQGVGFSDLEAFTARILLIHEYRRIVLRDPFLPVEVLPEDWPGTAARALCASVYLRLIEASERWIDQAAIGEDGLTLAKGADSEIDHRFQR